MCLPFILVHLPFCKPLFTYPITLLFSVCGPRHPGSAQPWTASHPGRGAASLDCPAASLPSAVESRKIFSSAPPTQHDTDASGSNLRLGLQPSPKPPAVKSFPLGAAGFSPCTSMHVLLCHACWAGVADVDTRWNLLVTSHQCQ